MFGFMQVILNELNFLIVLFIKCKPPLMLDYYQSLHTRHVESWMLSEPVQTHTRHTHAHTHSTTLYIELTYLSLYKVKQSRI